MQYVSLDVLETQNIKGGKKEDFFFFFWENGRLLAEKSLFIHYRMQIYLNYQNDCFD